MKTAFQNKKGFTLTELVMVIIIIGIVATVGMRNMSGSIESAKYEHTKIEMQQLVYAITGDPDTYSGGSRADYGYVGDIGTLPLDLNALVSNPGGYSTWKGPYISNVNNSDDYKKDAWNTYYFYNGNLIRSTGSGSNIDKELPATSTDLLHNTVTGFIVDANNNSPGAVYADSLFLSLEYPDGTGGMAVSTKTPDKNGAFSFSNIPVGNHLLKIIYYPDTDTVTSRVAVTPRSNIMINITFPADLWQ